RERARFQQQNAQSARVAQLRLIEDVVAETLFLERDTDLPEPADTELQLRQHEGQRRRRHLATVQADEQTTVGHYGIRMRPGFASRGLHEAERLVELQR